jgi:tellurite methyltransferase
VKSTEPSPARPPARPIAQPAAFLHAHGPRLVEATRSAPLVDLASGRGRNSLATAALGIPTVALDRNDSFLRELGEVAKQRALAIWRVRCDLETAHSIPLVAGSCGAALVFRFLHRPLCPLIEDLLQPGGWLLYETFTAQQAERVGGPSNPRMLLEKGELPKLFPGLEVHSFEEFSNSDEATARLLARKPES